MTDRVKRAGHVVPDRRIIFRENELCDVVSVGYEQRAVSGAILPHGRRQILSFLLSSDIVSTALLFGASPYFLVEAITRVRYRTLLVSPTDGSEAPSMNSASAPLRNWPLLRSCEIEEVREAIGRVYVKPRLQPGRGVAGLDATLNGCRLRHTQLFYVAYGADITFEFEANSFVSLVLPIRGANEIVCSETAIALAPGGAAVISPDRAHETRYSADYQAIVMTIDARALTEKLAALAGVAVDPPLRIETQPSSEHPAVQALQQYLPMLAGTLDASVRPFPEWWTTHTEEFLMTLFLFGYRHNYSRLLEGEAPAAALWEVRRAEEYIEANALRGVTLEELAGVAGVSAFSLFRSFKKYRGYSPLAFLSQVRVRNQGSRR